MPMSVVAEILLQYRTATLTSRIAISRILHCYSQPREVEWHDSSGVTLQRCDEHVN